MKKTDINGEKGVQITNVAKKTEVTFWAKIMTMEFRGLYMEFIFLLRDWYDQKLELLLLAVLTWLKIKFEHTQISVRKIDISMSKTAWTNTLSLVDSSNRTVKWSHTMISSCCFFSEESDHWLFSLIEKQCLIYFTKVCLKFNGRRKLRYKTQWKIQLLPLLYG